MIADHDAESLPAPSAVRWLEEHGDALYAYALARVRDPHAAEDLVQETLMAGLGSAGGFEGRAAERTWLIGILRHKLLDCLRRNLRERPLGETGDDGLEDLFDRSGRWKVSPTTWDADPHVLAEWAEFRQVLAQCLSRLPARMAHVFWLREAEEVDTPELCDRLNVTAANVWALLHRARCGLRKCLTAHWFEGDHPR
ncbi:MAG TPA: sigma-70 family RNA polymerase sigma factor [Tepidisphaeraceae bacterium]|jgi:RNA polymerase sigma-70 factor (ECF subfamily)